MNTSILKRIIGDVSGAVADLGVMLPLTAALVVRNGFDAATVLVCAGGAYILAGVYFGIPVPVQPIKAAAALTLALGLPASTLVAAGLIIGIATFGLGVTGGARRLSTAFARPVIRALQLGVGLLLLRAAADLVLPRGSSEALMATGIAVVLSIVTKRWGSAPLAAIMVAAGVAWTIATGDTSIGFRVDVWTPQAGLLNAFDASTLWTALTVLVLPQLPLTFGNAVVATVDLEQAYFGDRAVRVTPASISVSSGVMNLVTAFFGGMPMCHGSNGLTAHYRSGARSYQMNLLIGGVLLCLGLFFGGVALSVLSVVPLAVLAGTLVFAAVMHASLVTDLRGYDLATAVVAGVAGFAASNLAIALALALVSHHGRRLAEAATTPDPEPISRL